MKKIIWIALILLLGVFAIGGMSGTSGNEIAKSIELRGYNFTLTDADGWFSDTSIEKASYATRLRAGSSGSFTVDDMQRDLWIGWDGSVMERAFYKPDSNHDDSVWQRKYMDGFIDIYVLDPIDQKDLTYESALEEAVYLPNDNFHKDIIMDSIKINGQKTTIDGKEAYLIVHPKDEYAVAAVQLDDGLIAVISVIDDNENLIRKITISKGD